MTATEARWSALLDTIDEGLSASPPLFLDELPTDAGPIPPALAPRATAVLHRMAELQLTLERDRAELARELAALNALQAKASRPSPATVPHFLDMKA